MKSHSHLRPIVHLFWVWLLSFAFSTSFSCQAQTIAITAGSYDNSFLADSDLNDGNANSNRHTVETEFSVTFTKNNGLGPDQGGFYRISYELIDESGTPVTLEDGTLVGSSIGQSVSLSNLTPVILATFQALPDPGITLSPKERYFVRAQVQRLTGLLPTVWTNVGNAFSANPESFLHFTGDGTTDAVFNARARTENLNWSKTHALATDPSDDSFTATLDLITGRFDDQDIAQSSRVINFRLDFDLFNETTGDEVPLENDGIVTESVNLSSYNQIFTFLFPDTETRPVTASIRPVTPLNSSASDYILRCTVSHGETVIFIDRYEDFSCDLPAETLLAFSGDISFGGIQGTMLGFDQPPLNQLPRFANGDRRVRVRVGAGEGRLNGRVDLAFGDNSFLFGRLLPNGDFNSLLGSETLDVAANATQDVNANFGGITLSYPSVTLDQNGARPSDLIVNLPQGLNISSFEETEYLSNPRWRPNNVAFDLTQNLRPVGNVISIPSAGTPRMFDEAHPVFFTVDSVEIQPGRFNFTCFSASYAHTKSYNTLKQLTDLGITDPTDGDRQSNDRYLRSVKLESQDVVVTLAEDRTSRLTGRFSIERDNFRPHFPNSAVITYQQNSALRIEEGKVVPEESKLAATESVPLSYDASCPGFVCAETDPVFLMILKPDNDPIVTPNGGIHFRGTHLSPRKRLNWGQVDTDTYVHRTGDFNRGGFFMPGYHLYAEDTLVSEGDFFPSTLLWSSWQVEAPNGDPVNETVFADDIKGSAYDLGEGDHPGFTYEVTTNMQGRSNLSGADPFDYQLLAKQANGGAKYYIRRSGVSGRQIAVTADAETELRLLGFRTKITSYQLNFLDNTNDAEGCTSWVHGNVGLDGPYADWNQDFRTLSFDCLGNPTTMEPVGSNFIKQLDYWTSEFELRSLEFISTQISADGVCPVKFRGDLKVGAKLRVAHVDADLIGSIAFKPDGRMSNAANAINGSDSQFRIPASVPIQNDNQDYSFVPVTKLRFNDPTASDISDEFGPILIQNQPENGGGFVTFAGTIDVPYFEDLKVQLITSANGNSLSAPLYLTPGWTNNPSDPNAPSFFNDVNFDSAHRGYPGNPPISHVEYRSPTEFTDERYLITATQKLFGLVELKYPLKWDDNIRRFSSMTPREQELLITQVEHQIEWMDAKFANISFGAEYDGIPQLKLSNYLNEQIDGVANVISNEIEQITKEAVDIALEELDEILEDTAEALVRPLVDQADPILDDIYQDVIAANAGLPYNNFRFAVEDTLTRPGNTLLNTSFGMRLESHLCTLQGGIDDTLSFADRVDTVLERTINAIDAISHGIYVDNGDPTAIKVPDIVGDSYVPPANTDFKEGILFKDMNGERMIVGNLTIALLEELLPEDLAPLIAPLVQAGTSGLDEDLNAALEDIDPTLNQINTALQEVRKVIVQVRSALESGTGLASKLNEIVTDAKTGSMLDDIIRPLGDRAWAHFEQIEAGLGIDKFSTDASDTQRMLAALIKDEFKELLTNELANVILGSELVQDFKFAARQALYDLRDRISSSIQSVLNEISTTMKDLVKSTVGELEEQINPLLGKVSDYMGSGEITGFVEINGDSLRKLRLDAKMKFDCPDEMNLHVYLEIIQYTSEDNFTDNGCIEPGEKAVEVRIGAEDVAIKWVSDIRASFKVKMTLKQEAGDSFPKPNGVGGCFELTGGTLNFQAFELLEFGATVAVGLEEAYLGAKARARFSDYEMAAGLFFGRTCTLEPLLFVDPDIGDVVTPGTPFTGVYCYGECWLPISHLVLGIPPSCMFRIDAGVGAGAFMFKEGPTFGGKMFLGVSGEALCIVGIKGSIKLILASQAGRLRGAGTGKFSAKIGPCPFCIKFKKSVKLLYDDGSWSFN